MVQSTRLAALVAAAALTLAACANKAQQQEQTPQPAQAQMTPQPQLTNYTSATLTSDLNVLTPKEREMIPLLIDACVAVDEIFWMQAYGDRDALLAGITDPQLRRFAQINYGPWDRLKANAPFLAGVGPKPLGAGFYPPDMTKEQFATACAQSPERERALKDPYSVVQRDPQGGLIAVPYHTVYAAQTARAASKLREAAALAEDEGLRRFLELRAQALLSDQYKNSDLAWLDMKNNTIDIVIGPIENYEDALFEIRNAHEAFLLIKDKVWSSRLSRYAQLLPELQRGLPVPDAYKQEQPGSDGDLNAYDVVFCAGDANAGSKTIAINLPNDEQVQLTKGTRRVQLKNAMRAKFDKIQVPIADVLVAPDQRGHITFDAFFTNVMFHEVAHGLGIKNTINGKGTVREALKEQGGGLEEGKADVLGLYMVSRLHDRGELGKAELLDNYVTYMAGIFRSVRFGASNAHGRANLAQFGFYQQAGAFTRDAATGTYRVDLAKMRTATDALAEKILRLQGDGDYDGVVAFLPKPGEIDPTLQADLQRLEAANVPVDIVFEQGIQVLQRSSAQ